MKPLWVIDLYKLEENKFNHTCMIPDCHKSMHIIRKRKVTIGGMCYLICNDCRTTLYAVLRRIEKYGTSISDTIIQE